MPNQAKDAKQTEVELLTKMTLPNQAKDAKQTEVELLTKMTLPNQAKLNESKPKDQ